MLSCCQALTRAADSKLSGLLLHDQAPLGKRLSNLEIQHAGTRCRCCSARSHFGNVMVFTEVGQVFIVLSDALPAKQHGTADCIASCSAAEQRCCRPKGKIWAKLIGMCAAVQSSNGPLQPWSQKHLTIAQPTCEISWPSSLSSQQLA